MSVWKHEQTQYENFRTTSYQAKGVILNDLLYTHTHHTSGPTIARGSVMVATTSLATSDTSRPATAQVNSSYMILIGVHEMPRLNAPLIKVIKNLLDVA